jgi:RNA polymerase sigma factor (sigma-70 family)
MAERIWNWEQERRGAASLPRLEYSVRSGLKLVGKLASEKLLPTWQRATPASTPQLQDDLIQEGLVALLDAFGSFPGTDPLAFEPYATQRIRQALDQALRQHDTTSPPRPPPSVGVEATEAGAQDEEGQAQKQDRGGSLPRSVRRVLQQAQQVARGLPDPVTLSKVSAALNLPVEQLRDYIELASSVRRRRSEGDTLSAAATPRTMLSVEGTVEISNPQLQDSTEYVDQDEWELWEGLLLDDGRGIIRRDELVENYVDETLHDEGDDDSWIRHQRNAGRLQDLIPDPSSSSSSTRRDADDDDSSWVPYLPAMKDGPVAPAAERTMDDMALEELIRSDLSSFLSDTLSGQEQQIVRLAYGLTDSMDPPAPQSRIARALGMDREEVSKVLNRAIDKLREAYRARYVEPYREDEPTIDSV